MQNRIHQNTHSFDSRKGHLLFLSERTLSTAVDHICCFARVFRAKYNEKEQV